MGFKKWKMWRYIRGAIYISRNINQKTFFFLFLSVFSPKTTVDLKWFVSFSWIYIPWTTHSLQQLAWVILYPSQNSSNVVVAVVVDHDDPSWYT